MYHQPHAQTAASPPDAYESLRQRVFGGVHEDDLELPGLEVMPGEIELQSLWFAGAFGDRFVGTRGETVWIRQFGHWNHSAGPDFTECAVEVDGEVRRGDIEFDPDARDWERHGHGASEGFDRVELHVFVSAPEGVEVYTRTSRHRAVPQVRLTREQLQAGLGRPRAQAEARLGRCSTPLAEWPAERIERLIEQAALFRLQAKGARLRRTAACHGSSEAVYQAMAEALGYRHNRLPMRVLAQRLPLARLRGLKAREREARLFGHAGFLSADQHRRAGEAARPYLRGLWDCWWKEQAGRAGQRPSPPWKAAGSRPGNHPQRRLGAMAQLIERWPLVERAMDPARPFEPRLWQREVESLRHEFWSFHYTLTSNARAADKAVALIGAARAADLLANVIYPWREREDPTAWEVYRALPAGLDNQSVRRAGIRLFGRRRDGARFRRRLHQQQGLLQLYADFCLVDDSGCDECDFPERLRDLEPDD